MKLFFLTTFLTCSFLNEAFSQLSSVSSVINFLDGKTFSYPEHRKYGVDYSAATLRFKGLEAPSNNPFSYNPYPNAKDFAGKVWDFPQNRYIFTITSDDITREYCIYSMGFLENGSVSLEFRQIVRRKSKQGKWEENPQTGQKEYVEKIVDVVDFGNSSTYYLFTINNNGSYQNPVPKAALGQYPNKFWDRESTLLNY
jgi:hypothetical protein